MVQLKHTTKTMIESFVLTVLLIFLSGTFFMIVTPYLFRIIDGVLWNIWIYLPIFMVGSIVVWVLKRTLDAEKIQKLIDKT